MIKLSLISMAILIFVACEPINKYFGMQDDNIAEETAEKIFDSQTGFDIDFSPSSSEPGEVPW